MTSIIAAILSGSVGAAIVGGIFSLITWSLNRKATKDDQKESEGATILNEIAELRKQIIKIDNKFEEAQAVSARSRILRFGDEVQHGERHSEEHFKQILIDIDAYEAYVEQHPEFKNHVTRCTTEKIIAVYKRCQDQNDFLV